MASTYTKLGTMSVPVMKPTNATLPRLAMDDPVPSFEISMNPNEKHKDGRLNKGWPQGFTNMPQSGSSLLVDISSFVVSVLMIDKWPQFRRVE